jgi:serine O-acetyltransferase
MAYDKQGIVERLVELRKGFSCSTPNPKRVPSFVDGVLSLLFPQLSGATQVDAATLSKNIDEVAVLLRELCTPVLGSSIECAELEKALITELPAFHETLFEDAQAIFRGDPAAASVDEVVVAYPGFFAICIYRIAHWLYQRKVPMVPRMVSEYAHSLTGIDIHPGATIGRAFVIDHGTGIVIGESTVIHDNVKIYQGVTLGALSVAKDMANTKRHPTIERDVVIYANATILGGETVIGAGSIVGGNVWITASVPPASRVYHQR